MLINPKIDLIINKKFIIFRPKEWLKAFIVSIGYVIFGLIVLCFWIALSN